MNPARTVFFTIGSLALLCGWPVPADAADATPSAPKRPAKAAFRVLHSNDASNVTNCLSARFPVRPPVEDKHIRDSVDEVAGHGIDVHMMQPGRGWTPWWQSEVLPMAEHAEWKKSRKNKLREFETYTLEGGDLMRVFVEQCRKTGQHPFASFRMNDQHHLHSLRPPPGKKSGNPSEEEIRLKAGVCPFYVENPQWRIGEDGVNNLTGRLSMDFAVPQVREYRIMQIRELVNKYDIDGLELDFLRHWALFNQRKTTTKERAQILTGMVRQIREILDAKGARAGRHLWLGLRIPAYPDGGEFDKMGIDLPLLAKAGVDIINASSHYYTDAQIPVARLRKQLPKDVALYAELHYTNAHGNDADVGGGKILPAKRRCTPLQLWTTAYLARRRGADGVSTFNFQYYRGTYNKSDVAGVPSEPPYETFDKISDLDWLARQPQHYVASGNANSMRPKERKFPTTIREGEEKKVFMDMTPPAGGWRADGKLRIQARNSLGDTVWGAQLNGVALKPASDVSDPFPTPYPDGLGNPEDYRAWVVPAKLLKDGENLFEFTYKAGPATVDIRYMDVALPAPATSGALTGKTAAK